MFNSFDELRFKARNSGVKRAFTHKHKLDAKSLVSVQTGRRTDRQPATGEEFPRSTSLPPREISGSPTAPIRLLNNKWRTAPKSAHCATMANSCVRDFRPEKDSGDLLKEVGVRERRHKRDRPIHRQLADWLTSKSFALFRVPQENSAAPQSCWMSKGCNHRTSFSRLLRSCSETLQSEGDSDNPIGSGAGGRLHGPPGLFFSPLCLRHVKTHNETTTLPFRLFKIKKWLKDLSKMSSSRRQYENNSQQMSLWTIPSYFKQQMFCRNSRLFEWQLYFYAFNFKKLFATSEQLWRYTASLPLPPPTTLPPSQLPPRNKNTMP